MTSPRSSFRFGDACEPWMHYVEIEPGVRRTTANYLNIITAHLC